MKNVCVNYGQKYLRKKTFFSAMMKSDGDHFRRRWLEKSIDDIQPDISAKCVCGTSFGGNDNVTNILIISSVVCSKP